MKVSIGVANAILIIGLLAASAAEAQSNMNSLVINGAGATFPVSLYKEWIAAYRKVEPRTLIKYTEVGSGEGIKRFLADTVDFGASDAAMTHVQIASAEHGVVMVPVTAGMVVLTYNLSGLNGVLKLDRSTYTALLMGKITRWNDSRIQAINPGLNLPNREILLVVRQDRSGTTFILSNHLSAASPEWQCGPGTGKFVRWPPNAMFARGNEGVTSQVQRSVGLIGYVEYSFAKRLDLKVAHLKNKAGNFVAPSKRHGVATLAANIGRIPADMRVYIPDPDGPDSYPLVSFTWLLLKEHYTDKSKSEVLKRFVMRDLQEGQNFSSDLGYISLPVEVVKRSKELVAVVH